MALRSVLKETQKEWKMESFPFGDLNQANPTKEIPDVTKEQGKTVNDSASTGLHRDLSVSWTSTDGEGDGRGWSDCMGQTGLGLTTESVYTGEACVYVGGSVRSQVMPE